MIRKYIVFIGYKTSDGTVGGRSFNIGALTVCDCLTLALEKIRKQQHPKEVYVFSLRVDDEEGAAGL